MVFWFGAPSGLRAQRVSIDAALRQGDKPYVLATGAATVSAKPDQAVVEVGVITEGKTAAIAAAENARQSDAFLKEVRELLPGDGQLKTSGYSLRSSYRFPKPGEAAVVSGYVATNMVQIKVNDLTQVGRIIDAVTRSGANSVRRLEFGLKNPLPVRDQALREAASNAKSSVEAMAAGLGLRVLRVLAIEEGSFDGEFGMKKKAPAPLPSGAGPTTPVEVGEIEFEAVVTLRAEIGQ